LHWYPTRGGELEVLRGKLYIIESKVLEEVKVAALDAFHGKARLDPVQGPHVPHRGGKRMARENGEALLYLRKERLALSRHQGNVRSLPQVAGGKKKFLLGAAAGKIKRQ